MPIDNHCCPGATPGHSAQLEDSQRGPLLMRNGETMRSRFGITQRARKCGSDDGPWSNAKLEKRRAALVPGGKCNSSNRAWKRPGGRRCDAEFSSRSDQSYKRSIKKDVKRVPTSNYFNLFYIFGASWVPCRILLLTILFLYFAHPDAIVLPGAPDSYAK